MERLSIPFEIIESKAFKKQSKKAIRKDPHLTQKKIDDIIVSIKEDPYFGTELIVGERGKRKARISGAAWRIIFCIVEECHDADFHRKNSCEGIALDVVIIRGLMARSRDYKRDTN